MKINWTSTSILVALTALAVFFSQFKIRQYLLQRSIENEKKNLLVQNQELLNKKQELNEVLNFLNSGLHKELIAKQQLNLSKQGEIVYNFAETNQNQKENSNSSSFSNEYTNFEKWMRVFLNPPN